MMKSFKGILSNIFNHLFYTVQRETVFNLLAAFNKRTLTEAVFLGISPRIHEAIPIGNSCRQQKELQLLLLCHCPCVTESYLKVRAILSLFHFLYFKLPKHFDNRFLIF